MFWILQIWIWIQGVKIFVDPTDLDSDPQSDKAKMLRIQLIQILSTGANGLEFLRLYNFIFKISPETVVGLARQDKTLLGKIPTKVFIKLATCDVVR